MGWGLFAWSGLTAINGMVGSFWTFLLVRMGIGIGRSQLRAGGQLADWRPVPGPPPCAGHGHFHAGPAIGPVTGVLYHWRDGQGVRQLARTVLYRAVPGLILAVFMFFIKEPKRGAAETVQVSQERVDRPIRRVLAVPTFLWLVLAGLCFNFATYACNSFLVPMLQRYFLMPLQDAAVATGVIVGLTGRVGLTLGGWVADKIHQRVANGRLLFAAFSLIISTVTTAWALHAGRIEIGVFVALFSVGWLFAYNFYTCVYTAIQDVVEPRLRATAMALFFAGLYLLGGGMGPVVVGGLSDHFAHSAMYAAGAEQMTEA